MEKLKELRKAKGISLKELGSIVGVAESTMSLYENGKRQPDYETLLKLAEFFGVTVDYLLRGSNESECLPEELVILNRGARKMSPENRKKLLDMARIMFKEDFKEFDDD
ncbi:MAG: helix-turn-helix domain-containing protein [[Eubacterium] siraeum]|uniref:HTH-type transcriptional regulator immR n=1 Tax=[Eubacterium] siraeum TaxID=39492 RepID=A0A175A2K7_9FIRM|nr:HTH-type transcriptional regulator immR [[Eubacterium] siraeum]